MHRTRFLWPLLTIAATASPARLAGAQVEENTPSRCQNGEDDDGDSLVDCDDDGCAALIFCVARGAPVEDDEEECHNGEDDDGDSLVDCDDDGCRDVCAGSVTLGGPGSRGIYQPRRPERPPPEIGYDEHRTSRNYPVAWAAHPITLRSGMLSPRVALTVQPIETPARGAETLVRLGLGASYGILDFWEVTVVPVPLRLAPVVDYENPAIESTFRVLALDELELALALGVGIPVGTAAGNSFPEVTPRATLSSRSRYYDVAHLDMALLGRVHVEEILRIDLQVPVATVVFASNAMGDLEPRADLTFIGRVGASITEYAFAGVESGLFLQGPGYDNPRVPLGFFAGAVIPAFRRGPVMDITARFGWPVFFEATPPMGRDQVDPSFWQLTFDVRVFSYLLP